MPPVPPATGWEHTLRLPRDHYVRLNSNGGSLAVALPVLSDSRSTRVRR
jgi:hypothetical protein